jgi:His/Glu/Gln/Arg/opine family amino acid ABC transporter permease subunit
MTLGIGAVLAALGILAGGSVRPSGFANAFFNLSILRGMLPQFLHAAYNTLKLAGLSELFGILFGLLIALFAISRRRVVRFPAVVYVDLFRGTPLLVQLLFIYFGLPYVGVKLPVFVAGVVALGLNSAAYVAEIFRAGIQSVERGQVEAARTLGMPQRTAMCYVVMPQAVRRVIPPLMNEFIALLKDSSLVSVLGAVPASREILQVARDATAQFSNATPYLAASAAYLLMTIPLTRLVNHIDRRLRAAS